MPERPPLQRWWVSYFVVGVLAVVLVYRGLLILGSTSDSVARDHADHVGVSSLNPCPPLTAERAASEDVARDRLGAAARARRHHRRYDLLRCASANGEPRKPRGLCGMFSIDEPINLSVTRSG